MKSKKERIKEIKKDIEYYEEKLVEAKVLLDLWMKRK
ncbi:hypothetical protein LCGC14_0956290 [marine sediment metagenome]|uniref:Uncharacterized protein n=1 Tax=marine sediment metagenome TaxID=412755 RepID=A0A0F9RM85_9ZZZZ